MRSSFVSALRRFRKVIIGLASTLVVCILIFLIDSGPVIVIYKPREEVEFMAMPDINNPAGYKLVRKKKYEVYCCFPLVGSKWSNKLEGAHYQTSPEKQYVISGTVGETWVIDAGKLVKTYRVAATGEPITEGLLRSKLVKLGDKYVIDWFKLEVSPDASVCHAMFLPKRYKVSVPTSWGDVLHANRDGVEHGLGDFIICADDGFGRPNMADRWVVNGAVFPNTYDMRAFSGLNLSSAAKPLPVPKSLLL